MVETRLQGCVQGMCEVGGKAMGGLQRWEKGGDLPGTHREVGRTGLEPTHCWPHGTGCFCCCQKVKLVGECHGAKEKFILRFMTQGVCDT